MDTSTDYYIVLGVDPQASSSTIKAAFKRLALQYHPDVYKGEDAQERMRSLLEAYQTLSDPEARKAYDARREGRDVWKVRSESVGVRTESRDDPEGRFAFPEMSAEMSASVAFKVENIPYQLASAQAERLWWEGLLRGNMAEPFTTLAGQFFVCHRCHNRWQAGARGISSPPLTCPACHASDWSEYLLLRCTHCHAVFESKEIHDPLRGNALYYPYELFPLCPHCRRSQWCPAENGRVDALRAAANRRAALLWGGIFCICALLLAGVMFALLR